MNSYINMPPSHRVLRITLALNLALGAALWPSHTAVAAPPQSPSLTVGAVIASAFVGKALVSDLIGDAAGEVRDILEQVDDMLTDLIDDLGASYGHMLDVTFDQLDDFTRTQLERVYTLTKQIQTDLQVGLANLNQTILDDLQFITTQVRGILAQATDTVVVAVGGALLIIDKGAFNAAFLIVLILLALGLIAFIWLLFTRRLPMDPPSRRLAYVGMGAFVLVFGGLLLPQGRAYALTWSGFGRRVEALTHPEIFDIRPDTVVIGKTQELLIFGARFTPEGAGPTVRLGDLELPVAAAGNELVAVSLAGADLTGYSGSHTVSLLTAEDEAATASVEVRPPRPLPYVRSWTITPLGSLYELGGDNTVTEVGCRASAPRTTPLDDTGSCSFEVTIRVDPGYELAISIPAILGQDPEGDTIAANGDANRGFEEQVTTYTRRDGSPRSPVRQINFDYTADILVGIIVTGSARSDTRLDGGKRGEFRATYTVFGRRETDSGRGADWTFDGSCAIAGTVSCGTFDVVEEFTETPTYSVNVTFVDAEGNAVAATGPIRPNDPTSWLPAALSVEDPTGQLTTISVQLQIFEESVSTTIRSILPSLFGRNLEFTRTVRRVEVRVFGPDPGTAPVLISPLLEALPQAQPAP